MLLKYQLNYHLASLFIITLPALQKERTFLYFDKRYTKIVFLFSFNSGLYLFYMALIYWPLVNV